MASETTPHDQVSDTSMARPSYLAEVAETIRDDALVAAQAKLSSPQSHSDIEKLLLHPGFFDYFKYELASRVADVLVALDEPLQTIYVYDPSDAEGGTGHGMPPDATVRLLVLVPAPLDTLEAWVNALDDALTDSLRELPSPALARRVSVLDVLQISVEEARYSPERRGLLSSAFAPPIKIWQCEL